jgi:DnaJ-class molecular chaperone
MYDRYGSSFEAFRTGGPAGGRQWEAGARPGGGYGFEDFDFSQFFGERFGAEPAGGFGDLFGQFAQHGARARRTASPRRGIDIHHEIRIPFTTAVTGGEVQIAVQRQSAKTETLAVKIPPGIEDGKKIRLRGQGEPGGRRGTPGDLLITVRVAPHPIFERRGSHLHLKVPVTLAEAALGGKVDVPTPRGTVTLRIPPGTSSGKKLRIKGHGVSAKNAPPGDLIAEVQIVLPEPLDEESREMIRKLATRYSGDPRGELRW